MSLLVMTFVRMPKTGELVTSPATSGEDLAGMEDWRNSVWGSEAARRRGAEFLPRLKLQDLYVENEELPRFQAECEMLLRQVSAFASDVNERPETIAARLRNFLQAIEKAKSENGGVYVG